MLIFFLFLRGKTEKSAYFQENRLLRKGLEVLEHRQGSASDGPKILLERKRRALHCGCDACGLPDKRNGRIAGQYGRLQNGGPLYAHHPGGNGSPTRAMQRTYAYGRHSHIQETDRRHSGRRQRIPAAAAPYIAVARIPGCRQQRHIAKFQSSAARAGRRQRQYI